MIRINLLPDEFRRSERTSTKLFAATLAGVIVSCSALGWLGYTYFGELGQAEAEHRRLEDHLAGLAPRVAYHDALTVERGEYEKRSKTIQDIAKSRMLVASVLDQMFDVVNNDGNTERHMAWFRSVTMAAGQGGKGPTITLPGAVQGADMKKVADLHEDMEHADFFVNIAERSPPSGQKELDPKRDPPDSFAFTMKWTFAPANKWVQGGRNRAATPQGK
jgi:hypothetical protein